MFWAKSLQKNCLYVHEKFSFFDLMDLKIWNFWNGCRGAMRSKTQWVFYRDLDGWPGPQKVQFGGNHRVTLGCRALLGSVKAIHSFDKIKLILYTRKLETPRPNRHYFLHYFVTLIFSQTLNICTSSQIYCFLFTSSWAKWWEQWWVMLRIRCTQYYRSSWNSRCRGMD